MCHEMASQILGPHDWSLVNPHKVYVARFVPENKKIPYFF